MILIPWISLAALDWGYGIAIGFELKRMSEHGPDGSPLIGKPASSLKTAPAKIARRQKLPYTFQL
jgi:hypothetical protein